jgi:hypothetical protein
MLDAGCWMLDKDLHSIPAAQAVPYGKGAGQDQVISLAETVIIARIEPEKNNVRLDFLTACLNANGRQELTG